MLNGSDFSVYYKNTFCVKRTVCVFVQVGDVRVSYMYAGRAEEGREDAVSPCSHSYILMSPYSHIPMSQVSIVGRQSPGPVITPFTTSDGYKVLFLFMEQLSMDVRCCTTETQGGWLRGGGGGGGGGRLKFMGTGPGGMEMIMGRGGTIIPTPSH